MRAHGRFDEIGVDADVRFDTSYAVAKRGVDVAAAVALLLLCWPLLLLVALAVKLTSPGPVLHWSPRIGRDNRRFVMPKFRTMKIGTAIITTHLLPDAHAALTPIGGWLRRRSVDELPQLWSVLCGDMSFVGPRPALFNQHDLIALRTSAGLDRLTPGITGWAQVNGRDAMSIARKTALDLEYARRRSLAHDLAIVARTVPCVLRGDGISH